MSQHGIESKQFEEKTTGIQSLYKLAQEIQASANPTLEKKLPQTPTPIDKRTLSYRSSIILPDGLNWQYIRLSLLCAGQAYLKTDENDYQRINEPIMSTYDICVNYAFTTVSWSEYIATSAELVQPGHNQIPPYYKVTFPYPPRPNMDEYSLLSEEDIYTWANAQEQDGELPFYPAKEKGNYVSDLVGNVLPPYPYIPPTSG